MPPNKGPVAAAQAQTAQRSSWLSGRGNKRPSPPRLPPGPHVCLMMSIIPVLSLKEAEQLTGAKNSLESWAAGLCHSSLAQRPLGALTPPIGPVLAASQNLLPFTPRGTFSRKPPLWLRHLSLWFKSHLRSQTVQCRPGHCPGTDCWGGPCTGPGTPRA